MLTLRKKALKLCTHSVVFTDTTDKLVVIRALQCRTNKSIAKELGISEGMVQFRIAKAGLNGSRARFRNGHGEFARLVEKATTARAKHYVETKVAPRFIPLARIGADSHF